MAPRLAIARASARPAASFSASTPSLPPQSHYFLRQRKSFHSTTPVCVPPLAFEKRSIPTVKEQKKSNPAHAHNTFVFPIRQAYRPGAYYYEVIECFRRLLLTGCLVFILPNSAGQAAVACVLAVLTVGVFALVNPYSDSKDHRAYTFGALAIFLTMFMGLVVKVSGVRCRFQLPPLPM